MLSLSISSNRFALRISSYTFEWAQNKNKTKIIIRLPIFLQRGELFIIFIHHSSSDVGPTVIAKRQDWNVTEVVFSVILGHRAPLLVNFYSILEWLVVTVE